MELQLCFAFVELIQVDYRGVPRPSVSESPGVPSQIDIPLCLTLRNLSLAEPQDRPL